MMAARLFIIIIFLVLSFAQSAPADEIERGKAVYDKKCWWCHGAEGAGDGPAAERLNPPPRDFTLGLYKWKSTPFDEYTPSDDDFVKMIAGDSAHKKISGWDGMSGTSMPGWGDLLSKDEVNSLAAYIKSLAELEKPEKPSIDTSGKVAVSKESIERGRRIFADACVECHGKEGRGDATKKLRDDWGARTWPRDLTKGWSFRAGSRPEDIYTRVTAGIAGTQMPSFADPASKKTMTEAQRWDVANYAASLDEPRRKPKPESVLKAVKVDGSLPSVPDDSAWDRAALANYYLFPQIIAGEKAYTPSLDSISAKALYNDTEIAFLLEWDDPTNSMPWDAKAREIADGEPFPDSVAIQLPAEIKGAERPYFGMGGGMGGAKPVVIWHWQSAIEAGAGQSIKTLIAKGPERITLKDEPGITASGIYDNGRWRVIMKVPIKPSTGPVIEEGLFLPIAFAAWDGSNQEHKGRHAMTGWEWATLQKEASQPSYAWPLIIAIFVLAAELLWLRSARRGRQGC